MNGLKNRTLRALARIGPLFSSHAWLTLFTLLMLMGLFSGLLRVSLNIAAGSSQTKTAASIGIGTRSWNISGDEGLAAETASFPVGNTCGQLMVVFKPESTARQIIGVLQRIDSFVVFGPNENHAFELRVGSADTKVTQKFLEESSAVMSASPNPRCK